MKFLKSMLLVFISVLFCQPNWSQIRPEDLMNILPSIRSSQVSNSAKTSAVYIEQLGNYNHVLAEIQANTARVQVSQLGSNNQVAIRASAHQIDEGVLQLGNNHKFIDISPRDSYFHEAAVLQRGRNQNLFWLGENAISEKIKVSMKGKNQTILIRNFN